MFSRSEFEDLVAIEKDRLHLLWSYRGISYLEYPSCAFHTPYSEESIRISRAPKLEGDNGLRFWIAAVLGDNWSGRKSFLRGYLSGGYFDSITHQDFESLVESYCVGLVAPPGLPLGSGAEFLGGLLMYSQKTEFFVSALAEYENEFIHFAWETTA
jgi:hypothetical protein